MKRSVKHLFTAALIWGYFRHIPLGPEPRPQLDARREDVCKEREHECLERFGSRNSSKSQKKLKQIGNRSHPFNQTRK